MNSHKKVVLYGIGGLFNYGCEAIVRGTVYILRKIDPLVEITYFTPRKKMDEKIIKDLEISVKEIRLLKISFVQRVLNKVFRILCLPHYFNEYDTSELFTTDSDILFSIGGDLYTIPSNVRKKSRYFYYNQLITVGKQFKKNNKKVIIFGASIGPFGHYKRALKYYCEGLKCVDLIVAREKECLQYLESIGLNNNTSFMPDPAFYVLNTTVSNTNVKKEYFGINLSCLSVKETLGTKSNEIICKQVLAIEEIIKKTGLKVLLIPHVFSPYDVSDNDYDYLTVILNNLSSEVKDKVTLVKPNSFIDAKKYIVKCKFVIAARMHCAINSICEGVPAIFVSYSSKSIGMSEFIYNSNKWIVSINDHPSELVEKAVMIDKISSELSNELIKRIDTIRTNLNQSLGYKKIEKFLSSDN